MKYIELGSLIKTEREKRGWEQADLAKRLEVAQQTVSRWEKGNSRPKQDDLLKLLELFSGDKYIWFTKAGYDFEEPDTSLAPYLPLQNLSDENFELFCRDFVQALNPNADVHRYGTPGHKQYGIDLYAQSSTTILDYQCKRHKQFGAAKVKAAIKKTTFKAKHHYLLLSRTATPPARNVIQNHQDWTLWDREDISTKLRALPNDVKLRLVDTYFPGKRKSFLGIDEPSPWLTPENYFLPFADKLKLFSHGWKFVGRSKELSLLQEFEDQTNSQAIIISGRGGIGKSRLLRSWAGGVEKKLPVLFVSPGSEVNAKSLELLPSGPAFLVIDDAHDRPDILVILNGIARTRPEMKVILSTRPYGVNRLKDDLTKSGLSYDIEKIVSMSDLSVEDAKVLAKEVLTDPSVNGDVQYAQQIAKITRDCPLATVIGSRLVGQGAIKPDLLNNDQKFREELLSRFRDVVAGEVGGVDAQEIRDLLDFLALIQPFNPYDPIFQKSAEELHGKRFDQILRHINMLEDSGVLLRRGDRLRIVPDLLADYIRAIATYDERNQTSTGYADRVFEKLQDYLATNLLVNISQLDWRLASDGIKASLLNEVWSNLKQQFRKAKIFGRADILDAIKKVSYYQPGHALDFVKLALAKPTDEIEPDLKSVSTEFTYQIVLEKIPDILRYVAYDLNYLIDTLEILKELAEKDVRETGPHPNHPTRVLQEIASFEPGKPRVYNDMVTDRAIEWLKEPYTENFSPFDVLDELLKTEGHEYESHGFTLKLTPFKIRADVVSELRQRIVTEALNVVNTRPLNEAIRALKTLSSALNYSTGILGQNISTDERSAWDPGIISVLEAFKDIVTNPKLDPYISVEIRRAVSWHSTHGSEKTKPAAREVLKSIPETLAYELSRAIVDGWGWTFDRNGEEYSAREAALREWRKRLVEKLMEKYEENLPDLIKLLEDRISVLRSVKMSRHAEAGPFMGAIMENSPEFTKLLGQHLLANPSSSLVNWFGNIVTVTAKNNRSGSLALARDALQTNEQVFAPAVAWSLGWGLYNVEVVPEEIEIIKTLASFEDIWARRNIVRSVKRFPIHNKSTALDILLSINIYDSPEVADEVLGEFDERQGAFKTEDLTNDQIRKLVDSLIKCSSIDEHNIGTFLSKTSYTHPSLTLEMLMARIEYKENIEKTDKYDPLPYSVRRSGNWRFHETPEYQKLLRIVRDWATKPTKGWIRYHFGAELFQLVSAGFDNTTLKVLEERIVSADEEQLEDVADLLGEADNNFVWDHQKFVINILEKAQKFGVDCYKHVSSSLHTSVRQGGRSGTPGQPFPEDITQRDRSFEVMSNLPIGSPGYRFYKMLHDEAVAEIKRHTYDESELEDRWV